MPCIKINQILFTNLKHKTLANYAASILNRGQAKIAEKFQAPELRAQMPTTMAMALQNQHISIPDAQALRTSPLRPVDVFFFTNIAPGTATAKSALHTGTIGDSSVINVTYVQVVESFSVPLKLGANNVFTYQEQFNNQLEQKWRNLRTRQDNAALAYLYAHRNQLSAAVINARAASANAGQWDGVNFALPIDNVNSKLFMQYAKSFMNANLYTGPYDMLSDLQLARGFEYEKNQGSSNANNYSFQFGDTSVYQTQNVIDPAFALGATLMMPRGTFAGLNWNEQANRTGWGNTGDTALGMLGVTSDPLGSGAVADVSMYSQRADTSANATGGSTQDMVLQVELTLTIGYVTPPLSLAGDSAVFEISQGS
jgi:hypothetical protein